MELEEFTRLVSILTIEELLDSVILAEGAAHVTESGIRSLKSEISKAFSISEDDVSLIIVGSAKLGFSISEKLAPEGVKLPRLRSIRADSDIDVAVVSSKIYELIWGEICTYAHAKPWFPWDSGKLGDYMIYGWLRPDHFPKSRKWINCTRLWEIMMRLSDRTEFQRRKVRIALYYSRENLRQYQIRGLRDCVLEIREKV